jgi:REP element-mobilizing transposase RayT
MIHAVWSTKNREAIITPSVKTLLLDNIRDNAMKKGIFIDTINCRPEHFHCLFGLNATMSVSTALNLMKGESSNWMNKQKLFKNKFQWADEYFAASVSESQLPKVRAYIRNQDEHHRKIIFAEEFEKFIRAYGLKK